MNSHLEQQGLLLQGTFTAEPVMLLQIPLRDLAVKLRNLACPRKPCLMSLQPKCDTSLKTLRMNQ